VSDEVLFHRPVGDPAVEPRVAQLGEDAGHRRAPRDAERHDVIAGERRNPPRAEGGEAME